MILTKKSHNCAGTAFVQGDSEGGSKLSEQTKSSRLKIKLSECHRGPGKTQKTQNAISNCLLALAP